MNLPDLQSSALACLKVVEMGQLIAGSFAGKIYSFSKIDSHKRVDLWMHQISLISFNSKASITAISEYCTAFNWWR